MHPLWIPMITITTIQSVFILIEDLERMPRYQHLPAGVTGVGTDPPSAPPAVRNESGLLDTTWFQNVTNNAHVERMCRDFYDLVNNEPIARADIVFNPNHPSVIAAVKTLIRHGIDRPMFSSVGQASIRLNPPRGLQIPDPSDDGSNPPDGGDDENHSHGSQGSQSKGSGTSNNQGSNDSTSNQQNASGAAPQQSNQAPPQTESDSTALVIPNSQALTTVASHTENASAATTDKCVSHPLLAPHWLLPMALLTHPQRHWPLRTHQLSLTNPIRNKLQLVHKVTLPLP